MSDDDGAGTVGAHISPSWTWGSSASVDFPAGTPTGTTVSASSQLAQIALPEPAVCSFYMQASLVVSDPVDVVRTLTINLSEGVGRVTVPREITFQFQPARNSPLEYTLPWVPVHALQVQVTATIDKISEDETSTVSIYCYFVLSPITRIPQSQQKLAFGMATPGEADDIDDELREDLESEGPTAQAAVMQGRRNHDGVDGSEPVDEDDEDDEDDDGARATPPWLRTVVDQLTARYGRRPTRPELVAAVNRLRARRARKLRTRGR